MNSTGEPASRDLARRRTVSTVVWWVPACIVLIGFFVGPLLRTIAWTGAFAIMGAACVANAVRCGRLHCYFTGPLYLLGALASLLYGIGILPIGPDHWGLIGAGTLAAGLVLQYLPEAVWGTYVARRRTTGPPAA